MARVLKDDHTGRMTEMVMSYGGGEYLDPFGPPAELDASRLDREHLAGWVAHLQEAEANTRRLRRQLEALESGAARTCPECDTAVTGRADQVYCGATCRQRARRSEARRG